MNKPNLKVILFVFSVVIISLTGCTSKNLEFITNQNDNCSYPGWNGIIPGQSNKEEVFQKIKVNEMIDQETVQLINRKTTDYTDSIAFHTKENQKGYIFIDFNDEIVQSINLNRYYIYLYDLVDCYGKPDNVFFEVWGTNISVSFLYSKLNIWASFTTYRLQKTKIYISPFTQVESIEYLSDLTYKKMFDHYSGYLSKFDGLKPIIYQPWEDFGYYQLPPININD